MKRKIETVVIQRETYHRILHILLLDQFHKERLFPLQKNHGLSVDGQIFEEFEVPNIKIIVKDFHK